MLKIFLVPRQVVQDKVVQLRMDLSRTSICTIIILEKKGKESMAGSLIIIQSL